MAKNVVDESTSSPTHELQVIDLWWFVPPNDWWFFKMIGSFGVVEILRAPLADSASSFPVFRWWMMVNFMVSAPVSGYPTGSKANRENEVNQLALGLSVVSDHSLMSLSTAIAVVFIPSKCQGCQGTTIGYQTAGFNASCEANATCTWGQKHGLWQFWQTLRFFQQLFNRPFKNLIFAFPPFDRWFSHQKPHVYRWFSNPTMPTMQEYMTTPFSPWHLASTEIVPKGMGQVTTSIWLGESVHPLPSYMLLIKAASGSGFDENSHMHGTNMEQTCNKLVSNLKTRAQTVQP